MEIPTDLQRKEVVPVATQLGVGGPVDVALAWQRALVDDDWDAAWGLMDPEWRLEMGASWLWLLRDHYGLDAAPSGPPPSAGQPSRVSSVASGSSSASSISPNS